MLKGKRILLIISGGIAAVKCPDLIRRLRALGAEIIPVMTHSAAEFVTPLSISTLAGAEVSQTMFDVTREATINHIALSRGADFVLIAPATADIIARMAAGRADDLATTLILAANCPIFVAPSMNLHMWEHCATKRNIAQIKADGVRLIGPEEGDMACGEFGIGRMAEVETLIKTLENAAGNQKLTGRKVLITSGPTHEPIDPVRYIANRSSGKQGASIAAACLEAGAEVSYISGPCITPPPSGAQVIEVETAAQMYQATLDCLPADIAICSAAVADWRVSNSSTKKIKKTDGKEISLKLEENLDILATLSQLPQNRPKLVIGFAAETEDLALKARSKHLKKKCDWIVGNDVSKGSRNMGGTNNQVILIRPEGEEEWPRMAKTEVARRLVDEIAKKMS